MKLPDTDRRLPWPLFNYLPGVDNVEALIPMTFFFCVAAVLILRPITKKLGGLIEAFAQTRTQTREETTDARVVAVLEHVGRRLDLMEERLDFTERLVGPSRERQRFVRHSAETPLT